MNNKLKAAELFKKEYSGITCYDILHGEKLKALKCGMKVKDAVVIIEQILSETNSTKNKNIT